MVKPTVLRQQLLEDGTAIETLSDGTTRHIDKNGKPINKLVITDDQIEAWKKQPKEQALKEAIELLNDNDIDIPEAKFKLDVLKFISEIQGALQPTLPPSMHVFAIEVVQPGKAPKQLIEVTPTKVS